MNIVRWSTHTKQQEIDATSQKPVPEGYVFGAGEGEHLIHFRDGGNIFTQQLPKGSGIRVHRHFHKDEAFYVLEGSGTVALNDVRHSCERGFSYQEHVAWFQ